MKYSRIVLMMILIKPEFVESLPDFSKWPDPSKIKYDASERAYYDHSLEGENWAIATVIGSTGKRVSAPTKVPMKKKLVISFRQDLFNQKTSYAAMAGVYMTQSRRKARRLVLINVEQMLNEQAGDSRQYRVWPYHQHHLLVIPKRHIESVTEITEPERKDIDAMQEKALESLKKMGYESITQLVREGADNKAVRHVHFHTIPNIHIGDLDHQGAERRTLSEEEIDKVIQEISGLISNA